jgi:hypothetical protein
LNPACLSAFTRLGRRWSRKAISQDSIVNALDALKEAGVIDLPAAIGWSCSSPARQMEQRA